MFTAKESHARSLAKAVSWRITGTFDTLIVSFFITGRLALAGAIAATEFLTKILLYYLHERAWTYLPYRFEWLSALLPRRRASLDAGKDKAARPAQDSLNGTP
jgi:uncharacterized membrane protein